jgi:WD40-like Beta Propeller Repeat
VRRALLVLGLGLVGLTNGQASEQAAVLARTGPRASLLDLGEGRSTALPTSAFARKNWDHWAMPHNGREAVRMDAMDNIAIVDVASGRVVAGFALAQLRGTRDPELFAELQLSPDGRFLLGYWRPEHGEGDPRLVVFDRSGRVMLQDSPLRYERRAHAGAFTWMPDGRAFYLAGRNMVAIDRSGRHSVLGTLVLPAGVTTDVAGRPAISPDGRWVALSLRTLMGSDRGRYSNQIYLAPVAGGPVRPLAVLNAQARAASHHVDLMAPTWSPDGRRVAFTPFTSVCHGPRVVPFDLAQPVQVDALGEGAPRLLARKSGGANAVLKDACGLLAWWRD